MKQHIARYSLTAGATALLLFGGTAAQASAMAGVAAPAQSRHFHLRTTLSGVRFEHEAKLSNGDYTAVWKVAGETIKVAAPSGSTVSVVARTPKTATVAISLPNAGPKPSHFDTSQLRLANSIVPNARAVGFTPAQVRSLVKSADRGIGPRYKVGDIIATPCASVSGDSGHAWGYACDTQKFLQDNGGGNWIIGDQVVGSGNDPCCVSGTANLSRLAAWVSYGSNNNIFSWQPNATVHEGGCSTWTASLGYNGTGLSASTVLCSDQLDPIYVGSGTKFGSAWSGCDTGGDTEGMAAADIDNNPSNASDYVTLYVSISWALTWWGGC